MPVDLLAEDKTKDLLSVAKPRKPRDLLAGPRDLLAEEKQPFFTEERISRGLKTAKETAIETLKKTPIVGFTPEQIIKGIQLYGETFRRPLAGLTALSVETPFADKEKSAIKTFIGGAIEPEKYPPERMSEALVDAGMDWVSAGALSTLGQFGYYLAMGDVLTRIATAGKTALLNKAVKNLSDTYTQAKGVEGVEMKLKPDVAKAIAQNKDIATIVDWYGQSKNFKVMPQGTMKLLPAPEVPTTLLPIIPKAPVVTPKPPVIAPQAPKDLLAPVTPTPPPIAPPRAPEGAKRGIVEPLSAEEAIAKGMSAEEWVGSEIKEIDLINNPSRLSIDERLQLPQSQVKQAEQKGEVSLTHIKKGGADKAKIFFRSTHREDFADRADAGIFFANDFGTAKHYAGNLFETQPSKMQIAKLDIKKPYYATKDEIEYHAGKRQEWVKKLKEKGYDAIVEKASTDPKDMGYNVVPTEIAVFNPKQIKQIGVIDNPEGRHISDEELLSRIKSQLLAKYEQAKLPPKEGRVVKEVPAPKGKVTILPRKEQLLTQIDEAIKKAPVDEAVNAGLLPEPRRGGGGAGVSAAAVPIKGYGIIEPSEKSAKVKVAKSDYAKIHEQVSTREETNVIKEALKIVAPARVSEVTEKAGLILRKNIADLAHKDILAVEAMKKAHSAFTWMSKQDAYKFIDDIEQGIPQTDPKLQPFADTMRTMLDERRTNIQNLGKGQLEKFFENYFPHIWKDPQKAKDVIMQIMGRKRLEGTKAFLKKRIIMSVKEGVERGLEPVSDNPVDLVLLKLHEMDRYLMAQNIIRDMKGRGLVKFVYSRTKAPEGYSRINDNAFTVYMPPELTKKEAFDSILVDQLMDMARTLNIDTKRFVSIGGKRWGYAQFGQIEKIRTKYAGPESVLAHEIGHIIGIRYGVYNLLGRRKEGEYKIRERGKRAGEEYFKPSKEAVEYRQEIDKQWRALADARWKGIDTTEGYKNYVRKSREKEAVLVEALIHAPKEFQRIAPDLYDGFVKFLNAHSELRPLLDVEPSLVLGEAEAKIKVPGFTTLGHYYAPKDVARLINNHLSPGIRNADNKLVSGAYNILRGVGNILNQVNLSLSGFHAINVTTDMWASALGLSVRKLFTKGQRLSGLKDGFLIPVSPFIGVWNGTRIKKAYRQQLDSIKDPKLRTMVEAIVSAGGRDRLDVFYYNQQIKALEKTFRDILKGSGVEKLWGVARLPFNVFGSVVEVLAKPIMEWYVPTGKLGLFAKLATHEMQRAESGEITDEQLWGRLASVWDSVDNRMGQLIYDNLFWNKTLKDSLMMVIRSVGWGLGEWREYAGAGVDLFTINERIRQGDKFFSHKMTYVVGAGIVYAILGAIIHRILTGENPKEPKDYYFPRTGRKNPDGSDERLSLPTYAKDIYAYFQRPLETAKNKAHPLIGLLSEEIKNEDFFNVQIADPKDPLFKEIVDRTKHIVNYAKPFSFKNYEKMQKTREGARLTAFVSITGITSAPAYVTRTPAQKLMYRYIIERIPDTTRTKEEYKKSEYRKTLKNRIRKGEKISFREAKEAYEYIGAKSFKRLIDESQMPPFAELFKRLSIEEALNVYAIANEKEKEQTKTLLKEKFVRAYEAKTTTPDMIKMMKDLLYK